jgi:hypothetical protein
MIGCRVLLKFVTPQKVALPGVVFSTSSPVQRTDQADEFGRLIVGAGLNEELRGTAAADGYKPSDFSMSCVENKAEAKAVTMEPQ